MYCHWKIAYPSTTSDLIANHLSQKSKLKRQAKNSKKQFLPVKTCSVCNRPFTWRKKWEKVWDEVRYCSDKCRMSKGK